MTTDEYRKRLDMLIATCALNQRYHQSLESKYGQWDKWVKVALAALTAAAVICSLPATRDSACGLVFAGLSLFAAMAVNVLPFGDWEKKHGELFRLWSDLRKDAGQEEYRTCESDSNNINPARCERLEDMLGKMAALNGVEPAADNKLLDECHQRVLQELGYDASAVTSPADSVACPSASQEEASAVGS